jgi:hypothetical protein
MNTVETISFDRVRRTTPKKINELIDLKREISVEYYKDADIESIKQRIGELDREWDIERTLELNAAIFGLTGAILAVTKNKRWLFLTGIVTASLALHAIQGWCPPVPLFRKFGVRTQKEIDAEKKALIEILENKNSPSSGSLSF